MYTDMLLDTFEKELFLDKEDFNRLSLSTHWLYCIDEIAEGIEIDFTVRITPRLTMKKKWILIDGVPTMKRIPVERVLMFETNKVFNIEMQ